MDRGASAGFLTELAKAKNSPCYLVDIYFDAGTVHLTDAYADLESGGNTYSAQGQFLGFSGLNETFDMTIPSIGMTISGIDQSWIAVVLATPYLDRRLVISRAFIDLSTGLLAITPVAIFDGRMDGVSVADDPDGGSSTVHITATNQWTDFEFRPGRHTNAVEQESWFPGDKFFEFSSEVTKDITWGSK